MESKPDDPPGHRLDAVVAGGTSRVEAVTPLFRRAAVDPIRRALSAARAQPGGIAYC
jgi:hypothetical protein